MLILFERFHRCRVNAPNVKILLCSEVIGVPMRRSLDPTAIPEATRATPHTPLAIKIEILRLTPQNFAQKCSPMGHPERKTLTWNFFQFWLILTNLGPK